MIIFHGVLFGSHRRCNGNTTPPYDGEMQVRFLPVCLLSLMHFVRENVMRYLHDLLV